MRFAAPWGERVFEGIVSCWCERGDSNPHGLPRQILSLVRLPIPPLSHEMHLVQLTSRLASVTQRESKNTPGPRSLRSFPVPEPAWIGRRCVNPDEAIEHAIIRASKKFREAAPDPEVVWRYASGVIKSEASNYRYTEGATNDGR
jgi:hypothetical protein